VNTKEHDKKQANNIMDESFNVQTDGVVSNRIITEQPLIGETAWDENSQPAPNEIPIAADENRKSKKRGFQKLRGQKTSITNFPESNERD